MPKKTLILGASDNPARYSYLALRRLRAHGHPVLAVGKKSGRVDDVAILTEPPSDLDVDTVTLYLNPSNQQAYLDYLLTLKPNRIIFNPGAENPQLERVAADSGITVMEACTLVLLSTGQF